MWNRVELKNRAKIAFRRNYWRCVLISFVLLLFTGGTVNSARSADHTDDIVSDYVDDDYFDTDLDIDTDMGSTGDISSAFQDRNIGSIIVGSIASIILSGIVIAMLLLGIFVFQPLEVGGCRFFIENAYEMPRVEKIFIAFKNRHYGKVVLTLFLRGLYIFLWTLLLVIPGIIKSYEYRMIPYLLADCPEMSRKDAFRISKEMMQGQKMNAFILDLSFIGWYILSIVTCGILEIFYVAPYVNATNAELFLTLREQYFHRQNPS